MEYIAYIIAAIVMPRKSDVIEQWFGLVQQRFVD